MTTVSEYVEKMDKRTLKDFNSDFYLMFALGLTSSLGAVINPAQRTMFFRVRKTKPVKPGKKAPTSVQVFDFYEFDKALECYQEADEAQEEVDFNLPLR